MDSFEWDWVKAEANFAKHRIDFRDAVRLFDADHFTYRSHIGTEERFVSVGLLQGLLVAVVWTLRGFEVRRIISARRARRGEAEYYRKGLG